MQTQPSFRLLSQIVKISDVDFGKSTFQVSTELAVLALRSNLTSFVLNLGKGLNLFCLLYSFVKDCVLPNEPNYKGGGMVSVNGIMTDYSRNFLKLVSFVILIRGSTEKFTK